MQNNNKQSEANLQYIDLRKKLQVEIDLASDIQDEDILKEIDNLIIQESKKKFISLKTRQDLRQQLFNSLRKLDILQELIDDNSITEIMINGIENIFIERNGRIQRWEKNFLSKQKLEDVIQQIVAKCNRVVNESSPMVDARILNGDRVHIILPPVALNGPIVTIRRFPEDPVSMDDLIRWGSITGEAAAFLQKLVKARYNIFISGGTGSGKTTFLNALSGFIPEDERIITIEDNAELQIRNVKNLVSLEVRNSNSENTKEISIRDLIKAALRMRPDRIIVGEVRGGEAIDMLQSLNTGHDGSLSTGHANSPKDMISRLETMVLMGMDLPLPAIQRQIASGIDIIVHLGRLRDKSRRVLQIVEVIGYKDGEVHLSTIYEFKEEPENGDQAVHLEGKSRVNGSLVKEGNILNCLKLQTSGIEIP